MGHAGAKVHYVGAGMGGSCIGEVDHVGVRWVM